ncbi:SLC13 family permease [Rhizobium sp. 16-449-1b]|uniref:SLC13 family permease n=1 Tax=Rhizobium sp. 16-449-1b TaxID=2819989 RepID=UPI001ADBA8EA|nr:SLC13 family permease [Rhizobium sp. 16-449-1b]MBO9196920.1 SLC13 family permease [Rhizobium sp. 16-449-1b]
MSPVALVAIIVAAAIVLFVWNRLPVAVVAMLVCLSLWASGILSLDQALAGFGDPVVIFIATLFVVSSALEITGVTAWIGKHLIRAAGEKSRTRFLVLMMSLVAILAMFVGTTGAVVALLPVVIVIAVRLGRRSSQLLMPLAFAAHAGSMLALTGTPVNVLISDAAIDAGFAGFGFFEFALVGLPLLFGSMAIIMLLGQRLLPQRNGAAIPADFSRHARTLVEQYGLGNDVHRLRIRGSCHYVGKTPSAIEVARNEGMQLVAVHEGDTARPISRPHIAEGDHVLLRGDADIVAKFAAETHLSFREQTAGADDILFTHKSGLAEVAIPPRSGLIGQNVFPGMVTESGDLIVLAVQKAGEPVGDVEANNPTGAVVLGAGDTMLLQGTWKALDTRLSDPDVLTVDSPDLVRRQAAPMGGDAKRTAAISAAMILLLATGLVPPAVAGLLAAGAILLSGILTAEQSYNAIGWSTVVLVAAMKPLGTAMTETGAAQLAAGHLLYILGQSSPTMLLAGLFLLTAVLGQFISNMATALIAIPIGVAAAAGMGISPRPVMMSIAVAASAAFLTPIAAPANALVMGPGGYTFGEYWKLGLPLLAWFFVVAVFIVPLIWSF